MAERIAEIAAKVKEYLFNSQALNGSSLYFERQNSLHFQQRNSNP
jgi:hypothetical protein